MLTWKKYWIRGWSVLMERREEDEIGEKTQLYGSCDERR
jgi:hypothetical protein